MVGKKPSSDDKQKSTFSASLNFAPRSPTTSTRTLLKHPGGIQPLSKCKEVLISVDSKESTRRLPSTENRRLNFPPLVAFNGFSFPRLSNWISALDGNLLRPSLKVSSGNLSFMSLMAKVRRSSATKTALFDGEKRRSDQAFDRVIELVSIRTFLLSLFAMAIGDGRPPLPWPRARDSLNASLHRFPSAPMLRTSFAYASTPIR